MQGGAGESRVKTWIHVEHARLGGEGEFLLSLKPILVRKGKRVRHASRVHVEGPCDVVFSPRGRDGVRVWIETEGEVR